MGRHADVAEAFRVAATGPEGARGLFRGTGALLSREVPFYVFGMVGYQQLKKVFNGVPCMVRGQNWQCAHGSCLARDALCTWQRDAGIEACSAARLTIAPITSQVRRDTDTLSARSCEEAPSVRRRGLWAEAAGAGAVAGGGHRRPGRRAGVHCDHARGRGQDPHHDGVRIAGRVVRRVTLKCCFVFLCCFVVPDIIRVESLIVYIDGLEGAHSRVCVGEKQAHWVGLVCQPAAGRHN